MNKKCTNSSCRKTFSTLYFSGICPFCGKAYPQLSGTGKPNNMNNIRILTDPVDRLHKVKTMRVIRNYFHSGLKDTLMAYNQSSEVVFRLRRQAAKRFVKDLQAVGGRCVRINSHDLPANVRILQEGFTMEDLK